MRWSLESSFSFSDCVLCCVPPPHRFDLRAVSASSGSAKKSGRQQVPDLLPKQSQQQDSKLRYRDGRVVSTKGEKVIIEKVGEDWDGGSRGKVYTKGKRGKGFH